MNIKIKIIAALIIFLIAAPVFAQQSYPDRKVTREYVIKQRFGNNEELFLRFYESDATKKIAAYKGASREAVLNLAVRAYVHNPNGVENTKLFHLLDPCNEFTMEISEAGKIVDATNDWALRQDELDKQYNIQKQNFGKADDCDPIVDPVCTKPKPEVIYKTDTIYVEKIVVQQCTNDTIEVPYCNRHFYAQLGFTYAFNNGIGTVAEVGILAKSFRLGIMAGYGQKEVENLDFWSQYAGLKVGWDFYRTQKTRVGIAAIGGLCLMKQELKTETFQWKGKKYVPYSGVSLDASHLFSKHFGIFGGIEFSGTKMKSSGTELLSSITDDNGKITEKSIENVMGKTTKYAPFIISLGLRVQF